MTRGAKNKTNLAIRTSAAFLYAGSALFAVLFFGEIFTVSVPWSVLPQVARPVARNLASIFAGFIFSSPVMSFDCWCSQQAIDLTSVFLGLIVFALATLGGYLWSKSLPWSFLDALALLSAMIVTFEALVYLYQPYWWFHQAISTEQATAFAWFTNADLFALAMVLVVAIASMHALVWSHKRTRSSVAAGVPG